MSKNYNNITDNFTIATFENLQLILGFGNKRVMANELRHMMN